MSADGSTSKSDSGRSQLINSRCYFTGVHLDSITRDWALVSLKIFFAPVSYKEFD